MEVFKMFVEMVGLVVVEVVVGWGWVVLISFKAQLRLS